jgi:REP element-mobilizing transposase RayT
MSELIHKSHNVSLLIYHFVCPAKYRRVVFSDEVDVVLKEICLEISKRYEITFLEVGTDRDHVHFLVQSIPVYSPKGLIQLIKSITAREIFKKMPSVKKILWGGEFWSDGYFVSTVGQHGNEKVVRDYVRKQGTEKDYKRLHHQQLTLF